MSNVELVWVTPNAEKLIVRRRQRELLLQLIKEAPITITQEINDAN